MREVKEECSVQVKLGEKICTTCYSYLKNSKEILKSITLYAMVCTDDTHIQPQVAEGIEKATWVPLAKLSKALASSYPSIRYVLGQYLP